MGRPVRLSFPGAAEIPAVPYQKTREREAEVLAIPEIPRIPGSPGTAATSAHSGIPAGGGAGWLLGNMKVNNDRPPPDFLSSGHFSWNFAQWNDNDRWAGTGNTYTSANSMRSGISHIAISTNDQEGVDRQAILQSIETLPVVLLQAHGGTGLAISIEFQISSREIIQAESAGFHDFMLFTVSAQGFTIGDDTQVHPFSEFAMIDPELGGANYVWGGFQDFSPWPNRIAILGTGGGMTGTPGTPERTRTTTRSVGQGVYSGTSFHAASAMLTTPGEWDLFLPGQLTTSASFLFYTVFDDTSIRILKTVVTPPNTVGWLVQLVFRFRRRNVPDPSFIVGRSPAMRVTISRLTTGDPADIEETTFTIDDPNSTNNLEFPGSLIGGLPYADEWEIGDLVNVTIWAQVEEVSIIPEIPGTPEAPQSPEIPPFGGTPGTPPGPDTPAVPPVPGIPKVPAIYENALYGRPAIPAFGIWAERLGMTMTHRVENELEIIDLEISGHDYLIRQDWVTPKDHRVRPFCWMQDERGIVQTVETADQSDEKTTRFSTLAIVNGPANATSPPLPADLEEGDDILAPGFRIQPEVINHVLEVHEDIGPQQETVITEVQVRVGWALTSFAVEKVLTRDDNHPADGALLTTIDTPFTGPTIPTSASHGGQSVFAYMGFRSHRPYGLPLGWRESNLRFYPH